MDQQKFSFADPKNWFCLALSLSEIATLHGLKSNFKVHYLVNNQPLSDSLQRLF